MRPVGQADDYVTGRIERVDLETGEVTRLYDSCNGNRLSGPNDIVFDAKGNMWFTDLGKARARDLDRGAIYWAKPDGSEIREVIQPFTTPNGIGLSPDEKTLYVAETEGGRLFAYDIAGDGEIEKLPYPQSINGGRYVTSDTGMRRFDSLAVEASGNVCVAHSSRAASRSRNPRVAPWSSWKPATATQPISALAARTCKRLI